MDYLLLFVILLFIVLSFGFKEGYYSDTNTASASSSMNAIVGKLNTLQVNLNKIYSQDLTLDAQSKLSPLLNPPDDKLYTSGVVTQAHRFSDLLSDYQDNLVQFTNTLEKIKDTPILLKEGTFSLSDALVKLTKDAKDIANELNQIPDS